MQQSVTTLQMETTDGPRGFVLDLIVCPSWDCQALTAVMRMHGMRKQPDGALQMTDNVIQEWKLLPASRGKQLRDYIPEQVRREYEQAQAIKEIAPNAAATFARRCLQSMVRDFWGVHERFLTDELDKLQDKVDPETWEAIEAVRNRGNIGKHMEKGVNLIMEDTAEEAEALVGLIDYLIEDWYEARRKRQARLEIIKHSGLSDPPRR